MEPKIINEIGQLVSEKTDGFRFISFLYTTYIGKILRPLVNHRFINILYSWYQNSRLSRHKIIAFIAKYKINKEDFEQPASGYKSFNDFFIRKLKPGKRIIDSRAEILISPADSKLLVIQNKRATLEFFIKNLPFTLETFLHDKKLANDYAEGIMFIFRLSPYDYHRFHFPGDGIPAAPIIISGCFDSVNPIVYKSGYQPLLSNERHIIKFYTQQFDTILMIPVGALMVGKIVHTYMVGKCVKKGEEAGYFAFGGSTVVLLFKKNSILPKENFIKNSQNGLETIVKMGQTIGKKL